MRFCRTFRLGLALVGALALMLPAPLQAARDVGSSSDVAIEVVAEGLSEPRGLAFGPGRRVLYVAEAGEGGDGPCAEHPILGDACYGKTGAITRIDDKGVKTAVKNLGSIAGPVEAWGHTMSRFTAVSSPFQQGSRARLNCVRSSAGKGSERSVI